MQGSTALWLAEVRYKVTVLGHGFSKHKEATMKGLAIFFTMMLGVLLFSVPAQAWDSADATGLANGSTGGAQLQSPSDPPKVALDVKINDKQQRSWYLSPVWLAIGGLVIVVVIMLIVMAARGGGSNTTVVRG